MMFELSGIEAIFVNIKTARMSWLKAA